MSTGALYGGQGRSSVSIISQSNSSDSSSWSSLNKYDPVPVRPEDCIRRIKQIAQVISAEILLKNDVDKFNCGVTLVTMKKPTLISPCGHIFDRCSIKAKLDVKQCPECRGTIKYRNPVHLVKNLIDEWQQECLIPTFSHFKEDDEEVAHLYLQMAQHVEKEEKYDAALTAYTQAFIYTKKSDAYAKIPGLYLKLGERKRAMLAYLHLAMYQLEEGKVLAAIKSLQSFAGEKSAEGISSIVMTMNELLDFLASISKEDWINPAASLAKLPPKPQELQDYLAAPCPIFGGSEGKTIGKSSVAPISQENSAGSSNSPSLNKYDPLRMGYEDCIERIKQIAQVISAEIPPKDNGGKFNCGVTLVTMKEPTLISPCGHIFDKPSTLGDAASPVTHCPECSDEIEYRTPVRLLKNLIEEWQQEDRIPTFAHFKEADEEVANLYFQMAQYVKNERKYDAALTAYTQALIYTKKSDAYAEIPGLYLKLGERKRAALAYLHLAMCQLEEGKVLAATESLESAESISPMPLNTLDQINALLCCPPIKKNKGSSDK